jgi:hypothetical protein
MKSIVVEPGFFHDRQDHLFPVAVRTMGIIAIMPRPGKGRGQRSGVAGRQH